MADGLHSPLTKHGGWPVVDGVATSYNSAAVVARNKYLVPIVEAVCPSLARLVVAATNPKAMHYIDGEVSPLPRRPKFRVSLVPTPSQPHNPPNFASSLDQVVEPLSWLELAYAAVTLTAARTAFGARSSSHLRLARVE